MNTSYFNYSTINQIIKAEAPALALIVASTVLSPTAAIALSVSALFMSQSRESPVPKIYTLQKRGSLAADAEKLELLKGQSHVLGTAFLPGEKVIYLTKRIKSYCEEYDAFDFTTSKSVGQATTQFRQTTYEERQSHVIYLGHIKNYAPETHKNVGSVLIKTILQDTWKQVEGRMELVAMDDADKFYLKLGFQPTPNYYLKLIKLCLLSPRDWANHPIGLHMHLPVGARALWLKEIEENPIQ